MKRNGHHRKNRSGLVCALDVGSAKLACFVATLGDDKGPEIVGIGHHVSRGVRSGAIADMDAAEAAIRSTVEAAEKMASETVREVVVNVSAGAPESRLVSYEIAISGHRVGDTDLRRILEPAIGPDGVPDDREVIHAIPVGYAIDGVKGVRDPRGMYGERLGVNLHTVSAAAGAVRNLRTCIGRCHLGVETEVVSSYASALACLVEDEKQLGVTLVDMGGGTTSMAVFFDGELVHTDSVPVGGIHVTNDIARGLSTPITHAERMKTLYGSALPAAHDEREMLKVPQIGEVDSGETSQVPRSMLVGIVRPRLEEIFEMVRARLESAGFDKVAGRRVVLTGGASQLAGARDLAAMVLDKQVRLGRPRPFAGLAEAVAGPAFSTCAGLVHSAAMTAAVEPPGAYRPTPEQAGRWSRFGQWIRDNF